MCSKVDLPCRPHTFFPPPSSLVFLNGSSVLHLDEVARRWTKWPKTHTISQWLCCSVTCASGRTCKKCSQLAYTLLGIESPLMTTSQRQCSAASRRLLVCERRSSLHNAQRIHPSMHRWRWVQSKCSAYAHLTADQAIRRTTAPSPTPWSDIFKSPSGVIFFLPFSKTGNASRHYRLSTRRRHP